MRFAAASSVMSSAPTDTQALVFSERTPSDRCVRLLAVGDIALSGQVAETAAQHGFASLFEPLGTIQGDILFGNLETALSGNRKTARMFEGDRQGAEALREFGFTIVHLANNHIAEHGSAALAATLEAINAEGIAPLGAGETAASAQQVVRTDRNALRLGWLGCGRTHATQADTGPQYWEFDSAALLAAVERARPSVDILIVSIHIGLMYLDYPHPDTKAMAERLMTAGADLVLMHHAHVLQGVEVTGESRVCCYNLGNFLLDWREGLIEDSIMVKEQRESAVFVFDLDEQGVARAAALPIYLDDECRVHWATGSVGQDILGRLARISSDLTGDFKAAFERQRVERNAGGLLQVLSFHFRRRNIRFFWRQLKYVRLEHVRMLCHFVSSEVLARSWWRRRGCQSPPTRASGAAN